MFASAGFSVSQLERLADGIEKISGVVGFNDEENIHSNYNQMDGMKERMGMFSNNKEIALHSLLSGWAVTGGGTFDQMIMRDISSNLFSGGNRFYEGSLGYKEQLKEVSVSQLYSAERLTKHIESLKAETDQFYKDKFATKTNPDPDLSTKFVSLYRGLGGHFSSYTPAAVESWSAYRRVADKFGSMTATREGWGSPFKYSFLETKVPYSDILFTYESVKGKYGWLPESELKGKAEHAVLGKVFEKYPIKIVRLSSNS
jgi:hypothetical protein